MAAFYRILVRPRARAIFSLFLVLCLRGGRAQVQSGATASFEQGVVVETIVARNRLGTTDLLPGDVLRFWERLPHLSTHPDPAAGELGSPFDWNWMVIEQSARGPVKLSGERQGRPLTWTVPAGSLEEVEVRPVLPAEMQEPYARCLDLLRHRQAATASDCLDSLAETRKRAGDWRRASWLFLRFARSLAAAGSVQAADASFQQALAAARDPRSKILILFEMGSFLLRQGRPIASEQSYLSALRLARSSWGEESLEAADNRFQLGWVMHGMGRMTAAVDSFQQALSIQKKLAPGSRTVAKTLGYLGLLASERGELESAEHYFRDALQMEEKLASESAEIARLLNNLATIYIKRGDLDMAEGLLWRALQIERRAGDESRVAAAALMNLADIFQDRRDEKTAVRLSLQALHFVEKLAPAPYSTDVSTVLTNLGELAVERGDLDAAKAYFRRVAASPNNWRSPNLKRAALLTGLGIASMRGEDLGQAEAYFRESLALGERLAPETTGQANTLHLLAEILERRGAAREAQRALTRALEILEAQISRLGGSLELKGAFRAAEGDVYRDAVRIQTDADNPEEAFRLLERFRARSFLALLAERDLAFSADIPAALDRQRRAVAARYDRNQLRLSTLDPEQEPEVAAALRREEQNLRRDRERIDTEIRQASPGLATLIEPETLTFEQIRAVLDPGTVMLSYCVGKEETQLFVVARGKGLVVKQLAVGQESLVKDVDDLRRLIAQARSGAGLGAAGLAWTSRRLYRLLVQPAEPWIAAAARIVVVPDGPLHQLPFAALIRERVSAGKPARSWQYLVEWKPLHTVLSGTVYAELEKRRQRADRADVQWVGFGDPWFPPRLAESRPRQLGETRLRSLASRAGLRWQRLPASRREVERIAALFPPKSRRLYLDREATEERAKALKHARIVHFATHGFVDDRFAFDSGLVLAIPEDLVEGRDNGLLQVWEIFESMRLGSDLVVLSGCETALGEVRGGEGMIGLTRAFQFAGARSVLASQWQVDDAATAVLMEHFYRHLRAGQSKDAALRAAQLELLAPPVQTPAGKTAGAGWSVAAPYFWAAMQLYGDWQ